MIADPSSIAAISIATTIKMLNTNPSVVECYDIIDTDQKPATLSIKSEKICFTKY